MQLQHSWFIALAFFLVSSTTAWAGVSKQCGSVVTFADGLKPSKEIHVATTGSNSSGDGSAAKPYATIGFAANQAKPGNAVVIHPGTYPGGTFLNDLHGTVESPIWIGGQDGQPRPVITGGSEALHLVRPRFVIVHDIEVANASGNGINADDGGDVANPLAAHHVVFRNLFIHNIGGTGNQDGLKLSGINEFVVVDCEITKCGGGNSGSGIDMVGCHQGLIARCNLHDFQGSGNAVQCKGGSEDVEVRWCRIFEAGQRALNIGGSTGFEFFRPPLSTTTPNAEARNIRVLANVIQGTTASVAFVGCVECVVAQNTIADPHNWIIRIPQETTTAGGFEFLPCGDNTFVNNLVYFDRSDLSTYVNVGGNTDPGSFTFSNNLWYAHDNPALSTPNLPTPETNGIYGKNPLLNDPATGDYHLGNGSPAVKAGKSPARIEGDNDGNCYGDPPSIGAFDLQSLSGNVDGNGVVDVDDLLAVINSWGPCLKGNKCAAADLWPPGGNGVIDVDDLLVVVNGWTV